MSCYVHWLHLKRKLQHVGRKWVICGSHPDCSVGQWVKWANSNIIESPNIWTFKSKLDIFWKNCRFDYV